MRAKITIFSLLFLIAFKGKTQDIININGNKYEVIITDETSETISFYAFDDEKKALKTIKKRTGIEINYDQVAFYNNVNRTAEFTKYITKSNDTLKVGDTLQIGLPSSNELGFNFISQGGQRVASRLANTEIVIDKIKSYAGNGANVFTKDKDFKIYLHFKGYGMLPVLIDYESALETGEIVNKNAKMSKDEAIAKLKESKELLDLEVISQEKYDSLKNALTPIIIGNK